MKSVLNLFLFSWLLFTYCSQPSQENLKNPNPVDNDLSERISRIENGLQPSLQITNEEVPTFNIEERLIELGIPGVSIAVIKDGELEWAKGYGIADSSENRPVTTETLFLAGSISKPVAATRAHQLKEAGIIHLDSNVNQYLADWKIPDNEFTNKEKVTTRRILNHTAGLTVWGFPGYDKGDQIPSVEEVLDGKGNTDAVRVYKEPGESWMYSGGGYTIMQLMISDLDQTDFASTMKRHVLDPLGMDKSTYQNPLPEGLHQLAATGYRRNGAEVEGKWPIYPEMAAAGLWTTPSQLVLWAREIQEIYQSQTDGLLKAETVNEMLTIGMNDYGLGPSVNEHFFGHGGADEGFRARMAAWKKEKVGFVIMVNSDNGSIIREISLSLANEYGLPGEEPTSRTYQEMKSDQLKKYAGTYLFEEFGEAKMQVKDKGLELSIVFSDQPIYLLPESDSIFFDRNNGEYFKFSFSDEEVVGVALHDNYAEKQ